MVEVPLPGQGGEDDLVQLIREGMKKIDESLLGAAARDVPEKLQENIRYIEELLKSTRDQSSQVIKNLDELIKSVKYQKSGSSGQRPMPPQQEQQGENKPRSEQDDGELKDNPSQQDQEAEKNRKPEDGSPDNRPGQQRPGDPPPPKDPDEVDHLDLSGRWGVLPPKIQKDILNFNIENFPQKYRKWLEEYYRRINRRPGR